MSESATGFTGVFCPSITITDDNGAIDFDLWGRHLDHLVDAGVNGILLFGSIGEFYAFSLEVKEQVLRFAAERINGRAKLFVGVGSLKLPEVIEFSQYAESLGIDALVLVSPYYFGPSPETAKVFYSTVAKSTALPIILYNFPDRTGTDLTPDLVAELAAECPTIIGIKDTVDTISHTRKIIAAMAKKNPDFVTLSGFDEYYLVNRVSGGNGVLSGLTNVEPETFVAMHRAYESGDFETAVRAAQRISHLMQVYDTADFFVAAIKGAVRIQGLPISTKTQEPASQLTDEQLQTISSIINS